jgi:hypothetical protein
MRDNIKYLSTSATGAAHALEFRGQFKTIALSMTCIALTALVCATYVASKAIGSCTAPCHFVIRWGEVTLAPAGKSIAAEILITGSIPVPARPAQTTIPERLVESASPKATAGHKSDRRIAAAAGANSARSAPPANGSGSAYKTQTADKARDKATIARRAASQRTTITAPNTKVWHEDLWQPLDRS